MSDVPVSKVPNPAVDLISAPVQGLSGVIEAIRRFLRRVKEGPPPVPCEIEPLELEHGFRLSGDLDLYSVESVRAVLMPELHGAFVLDVAGVRFVDDSGLGLLVGSIKQLREQGGTLVLRNPTTELRKLLDITGLDRVEGLRVEPEV
jgi:anti-sigma B factor antagonist